MSEVFGFEEFANELDAFEQKSYKAKEGLHEIADKMRDDARRNAQSQGLEVTGKLVSGINTEKFGDEALVGWSPRPGLHGYFHEIGTYKDPAKPHMRPAFDENEQKFEEMVQNKIT